MFLACIEYTFYICRRSVVGRYESQQNDTNVYCEPQKGIVNLSADTGSSTENNHYAQMSDI